MFDKDAGGEISEAEFREGFHSLKLPVKKHQVQELFRGYDTNSSGCISTHEFAQTSLGIEKEASECAATPKLEQSRAVTPPALTPLRSVRTPGSRAASRQGLRGRGMTPREEERMLPRGAAAVAINPSIGTLSRPVSRMGMGAPHGPGTPSRLSTPVKLERAHTPVNLVRAHTSHSTRVRPATTKDKCSTPAMLSHNNLSFAGYEAHNRPASVAC